MGLKCCSACPTAETYKSLALRGLFAILNLLWVASKNYLRPVQNNLSTRCRESKRSESLLKEKYRWCKKPFLLIQLREHTSQCTGNFFGDDDDDATDLPAVLSGGPDSNNNSTQSSLNVPISVQHSSHMCATGKLNGKAGILMDLWLNNYTV